MDSLGTYRIDKVPVGTHAIELHCTSVTGVGAEIATYRIDVSDDELRIGDVRVPSGYCSEPAFSERYGVFRGYWTPGFESSAFRPCEDRAGGIVLPLLPGKRIFEPKAWAVFAPGSEPRRNMWPKNPPIDEWGYSRYFATWRGTLKGPGRYGHLGVSEFSMEVDSVLSITTKPDRPCKISAS